MTGVFACVMCWSVNGDVCIWYSAVGVDKVWLVVVGVGEMVSAVVPKHFASCCNISPCRPCKLWFYFTCFLIAPVSVVAVFDVVSIVVSFGMLQCCG